VLLGAEFGVPYDKEITMLRHQRTPDAAPARFGLFYPRGYLAVAFRHRSDAGRVREHLVAAGYDGNDAQIVPASAVQEGATRSLQQASPLVRLLGWEHEALAAHVELARQGYTFMLIYVPYGLAHKFDRFAVQEL
jgi:hypothetical protein